MKPDKNTALMIVDMQKYYCLPESPYCLYSESLYNGSLDYIHNRLKDIVIPNIRHLLKTFREKKQKIIYLKLSGKKKDRSDLHQLFSTHHHNAEKNGYPGCYPLKNENWAEIIEEIKPLKNEKIFYKTTFSAFNSTNIKRYLIKKKITSIAMCGLATSQCVETTARDASDHNFHIFSIEDAQADYDHDSHSASLYSSRSVLGGNIYNTQDFIFFNQ